MATGRVSGNVDWEGLDSELTMDGSRREGELFGDFDGIGPDIGAVDLQGVGKDTDAISDSGSADSWSAELGLLEDDAGKGKKKRGKAKGKGKVKTNKGKGKEKQKQKQKPKENEYERSKRENMARNAVLMKSMGLDQAAADMGFSRPKPRPRVTKDKNLPPALPERRSKRTG